MKKLLILMLVLGLTSLASAAMTLQISVNGEKNPVDSQFVVLDVPSGHLVLDIWTTGPITPAGGAEGYYALVCRTTGGTITGGIHIPAKPIDELGVVIYDDAVGGGVPGLPEGENGVWGGVVLTGLGTYAAGDTIFDEIDFHCEGMGDVIITLYETDFVGAPVFMDSVVIHQIPEPATMLLLGLGGLFLRRRK